MFINRELQSVARAYHAKNAGALGLPAWSDEPARVTADKDSGRLAGLAFDGLKHDPNHPDVRAAYDALKRETLAQFEHAKAAGYVFTPWTQPGQPYENSAEMIADVAKNKRLFYFPTDAGFGEDARFHDHPLHEMSPAGVRYNDVFRAIHDLYAHAVHGHQFGPTGELRAWVEHARMFSPLARKALTTETHGQNSWVNFGPHEPWKVPMTARPYADQKAAILPESAHPKVKLSREELEAHERGVLANPAEDTGWLALADHHQEHGNDLLAAHIRKYVEQRRTIPFLNNPDRAHILRDAYFTSHHALDRSLSTLDPGRIGHLTTGHFAPGGPMGTPGAWVPAPYHVHHFPNHIITMRLASGHPVHVVFPDPHTKLARPPERDAIAEDVRTYRQHVRAKLPHAYHRFFNTPAEHPFMHEWFTKRGLKVVKSNYTYYDHDTHTLYHHDPENKSSVVASYLGFMHEPVHLARNEMQTIGQGGANRRASSANHDTRIALVKQILSEAGLTGSRVQSVLSQTGAQGVRPAVSAILANADPRVARFAAAWVGLLTGTPRLTVFHPGEGEDALHIVDSPHPPEHVGEYLKRAGVPQFSMHAHAGGTRAYVVNPMDLLDVETAARGLQGTTQKITGTAVRLGAGSAKDARAAYRTVIEDAEKEAGGQ